MDDWQAAWYHPELPWEEAAWYHEITLGFKSEPFLVALVCLNILKSVFSLIKVRINPVAPPA